MEELIEWTWRSHHKDHTSCL